MRYGNKPDAPQVDQENPPGEKAARVLMTIQPTLVARRAPIFGKEHNFLVYAPVEGTFIMPRMLQAQDIIGHRLVRIAQTYAMLDGWLDHVRVWFVLENGVGFELPGFSDCPFEESAAPEGSTSAIGEAVDAVLGARVSRVVRPTKDDDVLPGTVLLQVGGRHWLSVEAVAPHGTGGAGVYISTELPASIGSLRDFWPDPAEP